MSPSRTLEGTQGRVGTGLDTKRTSADRLGAERSQVQILSPRSQTISSDAFAILQEMAGRDPSR